MVRSLSLADVITVGNALCGMGAILASISYVENRSRTAILTALVLLPIALIYDALDGAVARWRKASSELGPDLDSLADIVSFGVAPAVLGFALGLRGGLDAAILCFFVVCGIARLARYNATMLDLADNTTGKVKYYEGTPIPTSLALVAMLAVAFLTGHVHEQLWLGSVDLGPFTLHPLSLTYLASGCFMISTIRVPKP